MGAVTAQPAAAPTAPSDWPTRVLALVPLMALALLWSNHHLGVAAGQPALLATVAAAFPVALGLIGWLLDKAAQESLAARLRDLVARVITWRLLLVLYLALGVLALTCTSVVVLAEDGVRLGRVTLQPLDDPQARPEEARPDDKASPARFFVVTHPFGRPFRLELEGHVPQTVDVFPLLGLRVRPSRDLRRSPSVLLRFTDLAFGSWRDVGGAELRLYALQAEGSEALLLATKKPAWALLVGREQPVPPAWSMDWRAELLAARVTDESMAARLLVGWKRPRLERPGAGLHPGITLRATLTNAHLKEIARARFVLGKDELQDQAMEDVP